MKYAGSIDAYASKTEKRRKSKW